MSYNKIIVVGNVGGDPEMSYTNSGRQVTNFSVAVNYRRRSAQQAQGSETQTQQQSEEETQWFRVVCWEPLAETAGQYAVKGRKVLVEGRFRGRRYTGSDGVERQTNEIIANRVVYLGSFSGDDSSSATPAPPSEMDSGTVEDLPF